MSLPADVLAAIDRWFADRRDDAAVLIAAAAAISPEPERVARCVAWLGRASFGDLEHYAEAACVDYRDTIWWAEYDGGETQLRDFTQPLP